MSCTITHWSVWRPGMGLPRLLPGNRKATEYWHVLLSAPALASWTAPLSRICRRFTLRNGLSLYTKGQWRLLDPDRAFTCQEEQGLIGEQFMVDNLRADQRPVSKRQSSQEQGCLLAGAKQIAKSSPFLCAERKLQVTTPSKHNKVQLLVSSTDFHRRNTFPFK